MPNTTILAIAGDGVGPEVMAPTLALLAHAPGLQIIERPAGDGLWRETGQTIESATVQTAKAADGVLFGATATPAPPPTGYLSPILTLRRKLGLLANVRHCAAPRPGGLDVIMVRDCVQGLYSERERKVEDGYVADYLITGSVTRRLASVAADYAAARRGVVTVVHKANVLRYSDGLFKAAATAEVERRGLRCEHSLADAAGYHLVADPGRYDVMVMTSHVGDILSDVGAAVVGGLGLVPSLTLGDGPPLAEPIHGSAPDIAGTGLADPAAMMLSAAMLLDRIGPAVLTDFASRLRAAVIAHLSSRRADARLSTRQVFDDVSCRLG